MSDLFAIYTIEVRVATKDDDEIDRVADVIEASGFEGWITRRTIELRDTLIEQGWTDARVTLKDL